MKFLELKIIPVIQVVICALFIAFCGKHLSQFNYNLPFYIAISILILIFAVIIVSKAILDFKHHDTTVNPMKPEDAKKIVDSGIYQYSRNPMYLAMLLMLLSLCIMVHNYLSLIALPIFWAYITRFQIIPEERQLEENFGKPYLDYVKKVRRWI